MKVEHGKASKRSYVLAKGCLVLDFQGWKHDFQTYADPKSHWLNSPKWERFQPMERGVRSSLDSFHWGHTSSLGDGEGKLLSVLARCLDSTRAGWQRVKRLNRPYTMANISKKLTKNCKRVASGVQFPQPFGHAFGSYLEWHTSSLVDGEGKLLS